MQLALVMQCLPLASWVMWLVRVCGNQRSSSSKKAMYSPLAWLMPMLRALAAPIFSAMSKYRIESWLVRFIAVTVFVVASVQPLAIMIISMFWWFCCRTLWIAFFRYPLLFWVGIITLTKPSISCMAVLVFLVVLVCAYWMNFSGKSRLVFYGVVFYG